MSDEWITEKRTKIAFNRNRENDDNKMRVFTKEQDKSAFENVDYKTYFSQFSTLVLLM